MGREVRTRFSEVFCILGAQTVLKTSEEGITRGPASVVCSEHFNI